MAGSTDDESKPGAREGSVLFQTFIHLMLSQVSSRIISFVFNVLVARRLTQEQFGLQAVQFHLFTTTILFISREGFRRGCLRGHVGYACLFQILLQSLKHLCHVENHWSPF